MNATMTQPPTAINVTEAALWAALGKVASKEGDRDELAAGGKHAVNLELVGKVDDLPVHYDVQAVLTVGHDQQKASSVTPDPALLLANVLAKLNHSTREKILRELPEQFAESDGRLPEVGSDLLAATNEMLKRLRAKKIITSRGPVRCEYRVSEPDGPTTLPFPLLRVVSMEAEKASAG